MTRRRTSLNYSRGATAAGGCLGFAIIGVWCLSVLLSLAISGGILAALIAGVYYLCTGEFLFASDTVPPC